MDWRAGRIPLIELGALYGGLPQESRTKCAQAGDRDDRRWSEREWMQAASLSYLQAMARILWVGLRLKGDPPAAKLVSAPGMDRAPTPEEQEKQQTHLARVAALRKHSPSYQADEQQAG